MLIQSFPSPRLVALLQLKNPVCSILEVAFYNLFTQPIYHSQDVTQGQLLADYSTFEFSVSLLQRLSKAKEPSMPNTFFWWGVFTLF